MKGIILAGGTGSRLYPSSIPIIKQLIPVYDKPMIYYPLSVLMLAGVDDILIISTLRDIDRFKELFGDGSKLGIKITYEVQENPSGIAEAFIIGENFIDNQPVWLILGDNLLYGANLTELLSYAKSENKGATIFGFHVSNPRNFGIVEFNDSGKIKSLEEKPKKPKSKYAIVGLYYFDSNVTKYVKNVLPSARNELEITDLLEEYLKIDKLSANVMNRGFTWFDMGNAESIFDASTFVKIIEERQGLKIGCIEEIAFKRNYINKKKLLQIIKSMENSSYSKYLKEIISEKEFVPKLKFINK